jgi:putative flippase GtrA
MWQKYYQLFWAQRKQLLRYFITGVSAVVLDIITLYIFKEYWHLKPVVAVIINQILMLNYVFFINKYWSLEEKNRTSKKQVTRFFILASFNYIFSVFCMWGLNEKLAFNYLLVRMFSIALMTAWNFLIYKFWVYRVD